MTGGIRTKSKKKFSSPIIDFLESGHRKVFSLLKNNPGKLSNLHGLYSMATIVQKQEMLRMVFDNSLYYQEGVYRTPFVMPIFEHNTLILKQNRLLYFHGIFQKSSLVRKRRFELPQSFDRYHLKVVRLPISPPPQQACKFSWKVDWLISWKVESQKRFYQSANQLPLQQNNPESSALPRLGLFYEQLSIMKLFYYAFW